MGWASKYDLKKTIEYKSETPIADMTKVVCTRPNPLEEIFAPSVEHIAMTNGTQK